MRLYGDHDSTLDSSAALPKDPTHMLEDAKDGSGKSVNSNKTVSVSTAGIRAILYQVQSLYLRTPVKLFRPSRFDYMAYIRELANLHNKIHLKPYSFRTHSSIGILISVFRKQGWRIIPDQIIPPLLANSATGVILYGSYLTSLDWISVQKGDKSTHRRGKDLHYAYFDTWKAGFIAGAAQSLAAAPVDAIYARLSAAEVFSQKHNNLWTYGVQKLKEIGLVGVFAGYSFSLIKESLGFAFYFSTFEFVKTQGYNWTYETIIAYRRLKHRIKSYLGTTTLQNANLDKEMVSQEEQRLIKLLKSSFILLAGASAALSLLAIQYPLSKIQKLHLGRLEALDIYNSYNGDARHPFFKLYYNSYIETYRQILKIKQRSKLSWFELSYKGFVRNAMTTIPVTSVGLLVFEIMRTKLAESLSDMDILEP